MKKQFVKSALYTLSRRSKNIIILKSFARFSFSSPILIALLTIRLLISNAYAAEPPALPELSKVENPIINNSTSHEQTISSFFKRLLGIKKSDPKLVQPKEQKLPEPIALPDTNPGTNPSTKQDNNPEKIENFIDLDHKKLPDLENIPEKTINPIPEQLDNSNDNSIEVIKNQDSENIDNLIPSLPADIPNNLDSTVPAPILQETLPPLPVIPNDEQEELNQKTISEPPLPPVPRLPPNDNKISTPQAPKLEKEEEKKENLLPVVLPSIPAVKSPDNIEQIPTPVLPSTTPNEETIPAPLLPPLPKSAEDKQEISPNLDSPVFPPDPPAPPVPTTTVPSITPNLEKEEVIKSKEADNPPPVAKTPLDPEKISDKKTKQTPIPVFVKEIPQSTEKKQDIIEKNPSTKIQEIPPIKKPDLPTTTLLPKDSPLINNLPEQNTSQKVSGEKVSGELEKFTQDEIQMLLYQNDELILGVLTEEARIEQMDIYSFFNMFKKIYDQQRREPQRAKIDQFIGNYDRYFRKSQQHLPNNMVIDQAFATIRQNNLFALKSLLDNYSILQKLGVNGSTLLHEAANVNNYYIAKFLIIRGINMKTLDEQCRTALDVANQKHNNIVCLISKATGRKQLDNLTNGLCSTSSNAFK